MIREIRTGSDVSILGEELTGGRGRLTFHHPVGTFSLTPASNILIEAIARNQELLSGIGIDWGSGIGCLAILAAKIPSVEKVYGLEISEANIQAAAKNAEENRVNDKVRFMLADSYCPFGRDEKEEFEKLHGKVHFILSNPPSSDWDDGFGFRRMVLKGAKEYLMKNGIVLLNISLYYRVVVIRAPLQGRCYTVSDAVDWCKCPTTQMVLERLQPQPFADLLIS